MSATADAETGLASVGELRIAYESAGTGAPAAMLIHGAFEDRTYFAPLRTHLAATDGSSPSISAAMARATHRTRYPSKTSKPT